MGIRNNEDEAGGLSDRNDKREGLLGFTRALARLGNTTAQG